MPPTQASVRQYGGYRHIATPNRPDSDPVDVVRWWNDQRTKPLFVYVIQHGEDGAVKIGKAFNPPARLSELQCGNPLTLTIRAVVLAIHDTEDRLHGNWWRFRVRGEWFGNWVRPAGNLDRYGMGGKVTVQPADHPSVAEAIIRLAREAQSRQIKAVMGGALTTSDCRKIGDDAYEHFRRPVENKLEESVEVANIATETIRPPADWPAYETWPRVAK